MFDWKNTASLSSAIISSFSSHPLTSPLFSVLLLYAHLFFLLLASIFSFPLPSWLLPYSVLLWSILFCSVVFCSILLCSALISTLMFWSVQFVSILISLQYSHCTLCSVIYAPVNELVHHLVEICWTSEHWNYCGDCRRWPAWRCWHISTRPCPPCCSCSCSCSCCWIDGAAVTYSTWPFPLLSNIS